MGKAKIPAQGNGVVTIAPGAAGTTSEEVQSVNANCRASSARGWWMYLQRIRISFTLDRLLLEDRVSA